MVKVLGSVLGLGSQTNRQTSAHSKQDFYSSIGFCMLAPNFNLTFSIRSSFSYPMIILVLAEAFLRAQLDGS